MYQDKLATLKKQLKQLEDGIHPDYMKRLKKLEHTYQTRQLWNEVFEKVEVRTKFLCQSFLSVKIYVKIFRNVSASKETFYF